jgi:hypothetical protein
MRRSRSSRPPFLCWRQPAPPRRIPVAPTPRVRPEGSRPTERAPGGAPSAQTAGVPSPAERRPVPGPASGFVAHTETRRNKAAKKTPVCTLLVATKKHKKHRTIFARAVCAFLRPQRSTRSTGPSLRGLFAPSCGHKEAQDAQEVLCAFASRLRSCPATAGKLGARRKGDQRANTWHQALALCSLSCSRQGAKARRSAVVSGAKHEIFFAGTVAPLCGDSELRSSG